MENLFLRTTKADDEAFLEDLFFDVRRDEFELAGLSAAQIKPLLSMQYAAQKQTYENAFPDAEHKIIEFAGEKIGRFLIERDAQKIHLIDIAVLREFRGRGIGGFLLDELKSETETITLTVFQTNSGAIRLYGRRGFVVKNSAGMYLEMEWKNVG